MKPRIDPKGRPVVCRDVATGSSFLARSTVVHEAEDQVGRRRTRLVSGADVIDRAADHLVYVVPDLGPSVRAVEDRLGVPFTPGGSHPGLGTRNVLLRIARQVYLELLGPDPEQPRPPSGPWLGAGGEVRPSLATWCVRRADLKGLTRRPRRAPGRSRCVRCRGPDPRATASPGR